MRVDGEQSSIPMRARRSGPAGARLFAWIVAVLLTATCTSKAGGESTTTSGPPGDGQASVLEDVMAPEWEPETRTEEIAALIEDGESTPQIAIDAFALIVEGVPGASASDLPPGERFGGNYVHRLLEEVRDGLTSEQRAFVDAYFSAGEEIGTVRSDGTIEPANGPSAVGPFVLASAGSAAVQPIAALGSGPLDKDEYLDLLAAVHLHWISYLPNMPDFDVKLTLTNQPGGMDALLVESGLCRIRVHAHFTQNQQPSEDEVLWYFAHELFHCVQDHWLEQKQPPAWLMEGSADWAAYDLLRGQTLEYEGGSTDWFVNSYTPLKARAYSAWPLFENARLSGLDVYASIQSMVAAPGSSVAATLGVSGMNGLVFRRDWSTRTLRNDNFDATWWLPWPTHAPQSGPVVNAYALERGLGTYNVVGTGDFSQPQLGVVVSDDVDVLTATPLGGPLTTWTALGTRTVAEGKSATFCFTPGECQCPNGATSSAIPMTSRIMFFSYPASESAVKSSVSARAFDPDKDCKEEPDQEEAESNGDPHLLTFDGLPYDVITLGEFVAARDPTGDLEVQTRHEPFIHGAGTTAVALGTGSSRITITTPGFFTPDVVIRVDGVVTDATTFEADGVSFQVEETEVTATWPDGSTVELHWFLGWFVQISVPHERAGRMEGLLGSADGDFGNDLRMLDGTVVDTNEAETDESPFVLSWAVTEDTTLFDYEPGESIATFRVPHPNPVPPPIDQDALALCETALGEQATSYEVSSCAYDVSVTEDTGFVDEYVREVEERVDLDLPPTTPGTTTTLGPPTGSVGGEPTLILTSAQPAGTIQVTSAGSALVAIVDGCPEGLFLDIIVYVADDPSMVARAALCDPSEVAGIGADDDEWFDGEGYLWLPGATVYEVTLEAVLGDYEQLGQVAIYTDPSPTVIDAAQLQSGDSRTLEFIADTVIYLPDPTMRFDMVGLDQACGVEIYWLDDFPRLEPWNLKWCVHDSRYDLPPTDQVVPLVVFNRNDSVVEIRLTPAG